MNCKSSKERQEDRDAVIVRMKQFGQHRAKSIARILGIAPSTVGHALNRQGIYHNKNRKIATFDSKVDKFPINAK